MEKISDGTSRALVYDSGACSGAGYNQRLPFEVQVQRGHVIRLAETRTCKDASERAMPHEVCLTYIA